MAPQGQSSPHGLEIEFQNPPTYFNNQRSSILPDPKFLIQTSQLNITLDQFILVKITGNKRINIFIYPL